MVTPAPTPSDVFEAATRVVQEHADLTRLFATYGVPLKIITMTNTPTPPAPFVLTDTPKPANESTATYLRLLSEAMAMTTGTPTPRPEKVVTATPTYLYVLLSDEDTLRRYLDPTSTPTPTPTPSPTSWPVPAALVGKIAFRSLLFGGDPRWGRVLVVDPDGGNLAYLVHSWAYGKSRGRDRSSPSGAHFVYERKANESIDLFLAPREEGPHHQITFVGRGAAYGPAWSPNGQDVAFTSNQEGDDDIFVVEIRDIESPKPRTVKLIKDGGWESDKHPSYSPDGSQIVFHSNRTGRSQIWVMQADGSDPHLLVELDAECWDPVWIKGW